jgi:transcriptional regulator with XRE-family HTH domain
MPNAPTHARRRRRSAHTRLRRERRARGFTQARLAAAVGVDQEAVSQWERLPVTTPRRRYRPALEAIFGLPIDELLKPDNDNGATGRADDAAHT